MTKARLLIVFGMAICALAAAATPALATFLVLLAEGTKELTTKIHAESKNTSEEEVFEAGGGSFTCAGNQFYGTEEIKGHETNLITVLPWYAGESTPGTCKSKAGSFSATTAKVEHDGCTFTFRQVKKGEEAEKEPFAGDVAILCAEGRSIHFKSGILSCEITVGKENNQSIPGIEYLNLPEAKPLDIHIVVKATGISYKSSGCLGVIEKEGNNATYKTGKEPILITAANSAGTALAIHVDPFKEE